MADYKEKIDALAGLMEEFRLNEAELEMEGFRLAFKRKSTRPATTTVVTESGASEGYSEEFVEAEPVAAVPEVPKGTPITSPMNGIFYSSPSPSSPPFVKEGETITAGQVVGLIEAMKVFNEIPSPVSGTVLKIVAEPGGIVQPGDTLLLIG